MQQHRAHYPTALSNHRITKKAPPSSSARVVPGVRSLDDSATISMLLGMGDGTVHSIACTKDANSGMCGLSNGPVHGMEKE